MTFNSFGFLVFLPVVVAAYYLCPKRFRWAILLAASCYFYMAFVPKYIFVMGYLVAVDYVVAIEMARSQGRRRTTLLIVGIVATVSTLFFFKYFNFFNANVAALASLLGWQYTATSLRFLLPLGLSFHTFQSLSYIIEVYRGKYEPERHIGVFALYVMFFPQLVAGPIERPAHLLPQLKNPASPHLNTFESGARLMLWGFFKKLVIADQLAVVVNFIYANPVHATGPSAALAMVFFVLQLYTDFSGYTDIARGSARLFGIELESNFRQPFFSRSIAEFWRRWHISLSGWFRDYFYMPLLYVAPRMSILWLYSCVIITFVVTGLWHGAGWTFITMGALFGIYIVAGLATKRWRDALIKHTGLARAPRVHTLLQTLITFALVCIADIFFRAPTMRVALNLLGKLGSGWYVGPAQYFGAYVMQPFWTLGVARNTLLVTLAAVALLLGIEYTQQYRPLGILLDRQSLYVRSFLYTSAVLAILMFGTFSSPSFIYFQF